MGIASMHGLAAALTSVQVIVRSTPTSAEPSLGVWRCAYCSSQLGSAVPLPSIVTTPNGNPTGSSALRRWAARTIARSGLRSSSGSSWQSVSRKVVSATRRLTPSMRAMACDIFFVIVSACARLLAPAAMLTTTTRSSISSAHRQPRRSRGSATSCNFASGSRALSAPAMRRFIKLGCCIPKASLGIAGPSNRPHAPSVLACEVVGVPGFASGPAVRLTS
jgi:hypothetical protein